MFNHAEAEKDEWWGFSPERGWVVLDRKIVTNRPGQVGKLVFLQCNNWTRYEEDRKRWDPPNYWFADRYLETLDERAALEARQILQMLNDEYKHRKEDFYSSVVQERHKQFLENAGRTAAETRKARRQNRKSHCWSCKQRVDNSIDLECSACRWIICGSCGACGCTYGEGVNSEQRPESYERIRPPNESQIKRQAAVFRSFKEASQYAKANPDLKLSRAADGSSWKVE